MTFQPPVPMPNPALGGLATQIVQNVLQNSLFGTTILHYQAQLADPVSVNFSDRGRPNYLAPDPGEFGSGIVYVPNPKNPLKGVFCQPKRRPNQQAAGIFYEAQMEVYLPEYPGDVYVLDGKYPKRQDRFVILGQTYYSIGPAAPCNLGDAISAWKIELNLERYPVKNA